MDMAAWRLSGRISPCLIPLLSPDRLTLTTGRYTACCQVACMLSPYKPIVTSDLKTDRHVSRRSTSRVIRWAGGWVTAVWHKYATNIRPPSRLLPAVLQPSPTSASSASSCLRCLCLHCCRCFRCWTDSTRPWSHFSRVNPCPMTRCPSSWSE